MSIYRVQLTNNTSAKNPNAEKIILIKNFDSLVKQASSKFNFKPKKIRFFLAKSLMNAKVGTEILCEDELQKILTDDIMLVVSNGEDFKRKIFKNKEISDEILCKLKNPPRYPYPTKIEKIDNSEIINPNENVSNNVSNNGQNKLKKERNNVFCDLKSTNWSKELNGYFPIFNGNVLALIKKTIDDNKKIIQTECDGYISFDYDDDVIFPTTNSWEDCLLRECRGLIVSSSTGEILARRFHKFFNIGEIENCENLSEVENFKIYNKLDGIMVSPIKLEDQNIIWATKRLENEEINNFVLKSEIDYNSFCLKYLNNNQTPIFEFCHDKIAAGAIIYPKKSLTLIAIRNNITGEYISIDDIENSENVPIVEKINFHTNNLKEIVLNVKEKIGIEGVVIYTNINGNTNLYKCKTNWYINVISSQNSGMLKFVLEYVKLNKSLNNIPLDKLWLFSINQDDDILAEICLSLLDLNLKNQANELRKFTQYVKKNISILENDLKKWTTSSFKTIEDRDVILTIVENVGWDIEIFEYIFENKEITQKLKIFLSNLIKKQEIEIVSQLLQISWNKDENIVDTKNEILDIITFSECENEIKEHVLNKYIQKKFSSMIGIKQMFDETIINISDIYSGSEGKIMGFYEYFNEKYGIIDLRVDLQAPRKEWTNHNGNSEYALFLVQSGKYNEKSISYAGIMLPTNSDFYFSDILNAFDESFTSKKIIKLKRKIKLDVNYKIFCDLDGVLADFDKGIYNLTGRPVKTQATGKMWQRVANCPNFFEKLDFMSDGKELWEEICKIYKNTPTILTGIPSSNKIRYDLQKQNWCSEHLGKHVNVITCNSNDKHKYASNGHILIDDRIETGRQWIASGGIFIHHIDSKRTIYELKKIFNLIEKIPFNFVETDKCKIYKSKYKKENIHIITDFWDIDSDEIIKNNNGIISIDSEWKYNCKDHPISIIQIATNKNVYIIDMINSNEIIKDQLIDILTNKNILKLSFGFSNEECENIGSDIINIIDLQEICKEIYNNFSEGYVPSLSTVSSSLLSQIINKNKDVQLSDWNKRPLDENQIEYAVSDVEILFDIYDQLKIYNVPSKNIYLQKSISIQKRKTEIEYDTTLPSEILFGGVHFTQSSKSELLKKIKPQFNNIYSEWVYFPNNEQLFDNIVNNIGNTVSIMIKNIFIFKDIQFVVFTSEKNDILNNIYSIISSKNPLNMNSKKIRDFLNKIENNEEFKLNITTNLSHSNDFKNILFFGLIGAMIIQNKNELSSIHEKIKKKIFDFEMNAETSQSLKFKQGELSSFERSIIHEYARNHNMNSESSGPPTERQLILTMKRKTDEYLPNISNNSENENSFKIFDKSLFNLLKIDSNDKSKNIDNSHDLKDGLKYDAFFSKNLELKIISEKLNLKFKSPNKIIILRGIPGSGKSYFANYLKSNYFNDAEICSADYYFENNGEYKFDKSLLENAHDFCYNLCIEHLQNFVPVIIIDNTNIKQKDYQKYIDAANFFQYVTIILEIPVLSYQIAENFIKRSLHNISINDGIKIFNKWESDDKAFKIEPFLNNKLHTFDKLNKLNKSESFLKWASDKKVIHYSKDRNKTHMVMAISNQSAMFLDISEKIYDEFLETYSNSINSGEELYLMELIPQSKKFKFFIDLDYIDYIDYVGDVDNLQFDKYKLKNQIIMIRNIVKEYYQHLQSNSDFSNNLNMFDVFVSGHLGKHLSGMKFGVHIKFPNLLVDKETASNLIKYCIDSMTTFDKSQKWNNIFDEKVYDENNGIRMIYSRKSKNSIDIGRVYEFLFAIDINDNNIDFDNNTKNIVKIMSIHQFDDIN